jgi:periplasmic divalent cation tolerance protein
MTEAACEVIITAPDRAWLEILCRDFVEANLAASAHVIHPVSSVYRWGGAVHDTIEARAFLRTTARNVDAIVTHVTDKHPYDVPNVTVFPIVGGNPAYLDWIRAATDPSA